MASSIATNHKYLVEILPRDNLCKKKQVGSFKTGE